MKVCIRTIAVAMFLMLACSIYVAADAPGDHPAYLHALTDLRHARALLDRYTPSERLTNDQEHAIKEINIAIREIKEAAIDDGKNIDSHPALDAHQDLRGRFHKALEVLDQARADIEKREDNKFARDLKHRALKHIDAARNIIAHAIGL
jgi:hypothetical protein